MKNLFFDYLETLYEKGINVNATSLNCRKTIPMSDALRDVVKLCSDVKKNNKKIIFIGNGGSASIASHQAVDFWKNGGIKAISFNDSSLLTCISNDYGYESVFDKPVTMFAEKGDLLVAISSSGQSRNIINAAIAAKKKHCTVVTMTGFSKQNSLRKIGDINFYVSSNSYGIVEILHLSICHSLLDYLIAKKK